MGGEATLLVADSRDGSGEPELRWFYGLSGCELAPLGGIMDLRGFTVATLGHGSNSSMAATGQSHGRRHRAHQDRDIQLSCSPRADRRSDVARSSRATATRHLMALFDDVGRLYVAGLLRPSWERFGGHIGVRDALELFCGSYAYERAGASPDYAPAAREAIADAGRDPDPALIWGTFQKIVDGPVNPKVNPLWHRVRHCDCLICTFRRDGRLRNLVSEAKDAIADDRVSDAHKQLRSVRGVGSKIASFFLRDVALSEGLAPESDRYLLQPVDMWVRRLTLILDPQLDRSQRAVADWIARNSGNPERVNAGLWYFGARIASRRFDYSRALADPANAKAQVESHVERMAAAVAAWEHRRD